MSELSRVKDWYVSSYRSTAELFFDVNQCLENGWELFGDLQITPLGKDGYYSPPSVEYTQVLVKYEDE